MTISSSFSDVARRKSDLQKDESLRRTALNLFQLSSYTALRQLRCEVSEAVATVHGIVPSYFLKQVAQTILQGLDGIQKVQNFVEVRQSE